MRTKKNNSKTTTMMIKKNMLFDFDRCVCLYSFGSLNIENNSSD